MVKIQVNSQGKAYYTSEGKVLLAPEGGSSGKYQLLQRISDDNGNEIGTVCGFFTGSHTGSEPYAEYAVVCLDARYRIGYKTWLSVLGSPTNMPIYKDLYSSNVWEAKETATRNTQLVTDYCTTHGYTSAACSHCRNQSFVIDGVTYYGQLPNLAEVIDICKNYHAIEIKDSSASTNPNGNFSVARSFSTSCQTTSTQDYFVLLSNSRISSYRKDQSCFVTPVLELPNQ